MGRYSPSQFHSRILAKEGRGDDDTLAALQHWQQSGRKLILIPGWQWDDLQTVFPQIALFDAFDASQFLALSYAAKSHMTGLSSRWSVTLRPIASISAKSVSDKLTSIA